MLEDVPGGNIEEVRPRVERADLRSLEVRRTAIVAELKSLEDETRTLVTVDTDESLDRLEAIADREKALIHELGEIEVGITALQTKG